MSVISEISICHVPPFNCLGDFRCGRQPSAIVVNLVAQGPIPQELGEEKRLRRQPFGCIGVADTSLGIKHPVEDNFILNLRKTIQILSSINSP